MFKRSISLIGLLLFAGTQIFSQVAKTQVVQLQAIANADGTIRLEWPKESFTGNYVIYKREIKDPIGTWSNSIGTVAGGGSFWEDKSATFGTEREYLIAKVANNQTQALGYIQAGNKANFINHRGGIILLIDSAYISKLSSEINTLKADLIASGWIPYEVFAGRNEKAMDVKDRLSKFMDSKTERPKTLYIIGHVPVPYSGNFSATGDRYPPDGHAEGSGNHTGAWPADVYYGDFAGIYTDRSVTCTTGSDSRNHNIPKDGKFDQSFTYENIELEIGRVDFYNMPLFGNDDTLLVKEYLDRVHQWRLGNIPFVSRALIDNNFTGLNLTSSGYHNLPTFVGLDSVFDNRDYFASQYQNNYLWSYGCGAGSYTSCSGIGSSNDFYINKGKFNNIFTLLAGSYFGDWDSRNNLMRSALAGGSLACAWAGIPKWYLHHMGIGYNIGMGAKITQSNNQQYFDGSFNGSGRGVHIALLGDPSLTMIPVSGPSNLKAISTAGTVKLSWNKSPNKVDGYYVFLFDKNTGKYTLASELRCPGKSSYTSDTFFTDECNWSTGNYMYAVRAMSITKTGSGTYENLSMATFAEVAHTNSSNDISIPSITVCPNPAAEMIKITGLKNSVPSDIQISTIDGKTVFLAMNWNDATETNQLSIAVDSKWHGTYILSILQNNQKHHFKILLP